MTYEIVDTSRGDVLGLFTDRDLAFEAAGVYLHEHLADAQDIAILAMDDSGRRVGDPVWVAAEPHHV